MAVPAELKGSASPARRPRRPRAIGLTTLRGGRGTLWGSVLGAGILEGAPQLLAYWLGGSQVYLIAYAAVFLVIMLLLPRGILPTIQDRIRRRRPRGTVNAVEVPP